MTLVEFFAGMFFFLVGFAAGATTFLTYGLHQVRKAKKAKDALIQEVKKKAKELESKTNSFKERLAKASKIAQIQMELRAQVEMPSKNGLHSKYKSGLITEIGELEQEKLDILKTVLAEGFNPMITVAQESGTKEVPLSEYVAAAQRDVETVMGKEEAPAALPASSNEPRKVGKFFIYRGGKDDGNAN